MPNLFDYHKDKLLEVAQQYLKRSNNVDGRTAQSERIKTLVSLLSRDIQETPDDEWHIDLFELNRILGVFKITLGYPHFRFPCSPQLWVRYLQSVPDLRELTISEKFAEFCCSEDCLEALSQLRNLRKLKITYDPSLDSKLSSNI